MEESSRTRPRTGEKSFSRECVELAALFLAVGTADLFAKTLVQHSFGPGILFGLGVSLVLAALVQRRWVHRRHTTRPGRGRRRADPAALPGLWRVRCTVRDRPGGLAALARALARHDINILSVQVHSLPDGAVDELLVHVPAGLGEAGIIGAVEKGGGRAIHVHAADPHELVDVPTQVLVLATEVAAGHTDPPHALSSLLDATVTEAGTPGAPDDDPVTGAVGEDGHTLLLADAANRRLILHRGTAFVPAECARAQALLALLDTVGTARAGAVPRPRRTRG